MNILSKSKRKYTRVTIEEVMELYNDGMNFSQISKYLDCARNTVRARIREYIEETGNPIPLRTRPGLGFEDINQVFTWYNQGKKVIDIAEYFNVTLSCIYKILKKYKG